MNLSHVHVYLINKTLNVNLNRCFIGMKLKYKRESKTQTIRKQQVRFVYKIKIVLVDCIGYYI